MFTKVTGVPGSTVVTVAVKHASTIWMVASSWPVASFSVTSPWQPPPADATPGIPTTAARTAIVQSSIPRLMSIPPDVRCLCYTGKDQSVPADAAIRRTSVIGSEVSNRIVWGPSRHRSTLPSTRTYATPSPVSSSRRWVPVVQ